MGKLPTLRTIASLSGLSVATVSRALRNDPRQSAATRAKIQALAKKLGYVPDPLISAWVNRRWRLGRRITETIAWITNYPTREGWRSQFAQLVYKGAVERARLRGFKMEHFWLGEVGSGPRLSEILFSRGIRGICIAPLPRGDGKLNLKWENFSCATVGYSLMHPALHRATPHHVQGIIDALGELVDAGHKHIGFCMDRETSRKVNYGWMAGLLLFQKQHPKVKISLFTNKSWHAAEFGRWFNKTRPSVILGAGEFVLPWLTALGLKLPVATLSWNKENPHTGLDQKSGEVGEAAIDLIIGQLQRNETGIPVTPRVLMIQGVWREA